MAVAQLFTLKENVNNRFLEENENTSSANLQMHQTKINSIFQTVPPTYYLVLWVDSPQTLKGQFTVICCFQ